MIDGLKFRMTRDELAIHLRERAKYHELRATAKRDELLTLRANLEKVTVDVQTLGGKRPSTNVSGGFNPDYLIQEHRRLVEEHERTMVEHLARVDKFRFIANHLFNDDYSLTESDIPRLELVSS